MGRDRHTKQVGCGENARTVEVAKTKRLDKNLCWLRCLPQTGIEVDLGQSSSKVNAGGGAVNCNQWSPLVFMSRKNQSPSQAGQVGCTMMGGYPRGQRLKGPPGE
jgi:hypothetical protein